MISRIMLISAVALTGAMAVAASQPSSEPAASAPVAVSVKADKKSYGPKEPIKLTMSAKNTGKSPVRLTFNSGMKYDFEIRKGKGRSGESVWKWSHGRMFTQMVSNTTLDAGKSLSFTETYAPGERGGDGKPNPELAPGTYTATAILATSGRTPRPMASAAFTVK